MYTALRSLETAPQEDASSTAGLVLAEINRRRGQDTGVALPSIDVTATMDRSFGLAPAFLPTLYATLGCFPEGMPLAYLIATVVTGLGLLIGSVIHVAGPREVARQSASFPSPLSPLPSVVGRITGMADCKWEKKGLGIRDWGLEKRSGVRGQGSGIANLQSLIPNSQSLVSLGDRFALASGLMEITYDTGAKVILQGPVTYEVEANGGYLAVGKLTGKLETRGERRGERGEMAANHQIPNLKSQIVSPSPLSSLLSPLFVIRTPTATVTDLGTEFGVEVGRDGVTDTQVFVGEVRIATTNDQGSNAEQTHVIRAGQAAHVVRNQGLSIGEQHWKEGAIRFVRAMPSRASTADAYAELVLSMKPAVYYRMEKWPKDEKKGCYVLWDSAPGAHHGEAHLDEGLGPLCRGRFGSALDLHGPGVGEYAIVPNYPKTDNDRLSVSAWVWAVSLDPYTTIVENWLRRLPEDRLFGQFALVVDPDRHLLAGVLQADGRAVFLSEGGNEFPRGRWQHVAFVADGTMLRLYRNGVEVGASPCRGISRRQLPDALGIGLQTDQSGIRPLTLAQCWDGRLDEIAIFNHALSAEQIRQLCAGPAATVQPTGSNTVNMVTQGSNRRRAEP